jgi:type VI secretion system protein ImpK
MSPQPLRSENLALSFQELLTVGERLRCNRQTVADASSFRAQIWAAVKTASDHARNRGYPQEDIELATFAVIAFVDESILNLRSPIFADWPRQPLQEERYGHHVAGEIFFQNLQKLLLRDDSPQLSDLLEVYYLCLMLGFAGRYSLGGRGELQAIMQQTADKLQRIRRTSAILSPDAQPPADQVRQTSGDSVARALMFVAIGCAVLAIALFIIFKVMLGNGVQDLRTTSSIGHVTALKAYSVSRQAASTRGAAHRLLWSARLRSGRFSRAAKSASEPMWSRPSACSLPVVDRFFHRFLRSRLSNARGIRATHAVPAGEMAL